MIYNNQFFGGIMDNIQSGNNDIVLNWLTQHKKESDSIIKLGVKKFCKHNPNEKLSNEMIRSKHSAIEILKDYVKANPKKAAELLNDIGKEIGKISKEENIQASEISNVFKKNIGSKSLLSAVVSGKNVTNFGKESIEQQNMKSFDNKSFLKVNEGEILNLIKNYPESVLKETFDDIISNDPHEEIHAGKQNNFVDTLIAYLSKNRDKIEIFMNKIQNKAQILEEKIGSVDDEFSNKRQKSILDLIQKYPEDILLETLDVILDLQEYSEYLEYDTDEDESKEKIAEYLSDHPDKVEVFLKTANKIYAEKPD